MDMSQYLEMFIEESKDHLQHLNDSLLQLENNPKDMGILNEVFRVAHTLKGMSGTMGYTKMQKLTHDMENVLSGIRNEEIKATSNLLDVLFQCLDALETYLDNIINNGDEGTNHYNEIIQSLNAILEHGNVETPIQTPRQEENTKKDKSSKITLDEYEESAIHNAYESDMNAYHIFIRLNDTCVLKSARAFIIFRILEQYTDIVKSVPKVEDIEDENFDLSFEVIVVTKEDVKELTKELENVAEVAEVSVTTMREMETEVIKTQKESIEQSASKESADESIGTNKDEKAEHSPEELKNEQKGKGVTGKTVRVDIDRLDNLMNLVSELIIIKTRLEGIGGNHINSNTDQNFNEAVEYLERITTSLHDAVMKVRMVPVERVFNRFPRMIRDLSRSLKKEIQLLMSGEETELDRTVIDEIGDPLIHILRNAADHGLETPEKRTEVGKPKAGTINLRAYQDGNNVVIEVEDDGAGINPEGIKKKAIDKGVISATAAANMSEQDCIELLFHAGFSTAEKITDVSGRGVGLDVVKTKIEALGGIIEVKSEFGKGSKFIIRLPLTLAIIQALMVIIGEEKYAIPLNSIDIIVNINKNDIQHVQKQEVYMHRNKVIPIIRLDKILEVPDLEERENLTIVIVKKGEKQAGFVVDSLIGQQEIVIKSLGKYLTGIKMIAGATILGDGEVALILDINSLVS